MNKTISAAAAALALLSGAPAMAQQYLSTPMDAAMAGAMRDFNNFGTQIQGGMDQITDSAMNDPRVQAGYQQFLAQGGQQDFYTWAQNYVASNGYSPDGVRSVYQQQGAATAALRSGWAGVQEAERQSGLAITGMQDAFGNNLSQAGMTDVPNGNDSYTAYDQNGNAYLMPY